MEMRLPRHEWAFVLVGALFAAEARAAPSSQDHFQLAANFGVSLNSSIAVSAGTVVVDTSPSFGLTADFPVDKGAYVQLLWSYTNTSAVLNSTSPAYESSEPFQLSINYFQIGGTKEFQAGPVKPYIALTAGAVLLSPGVIVLTSGTTVPNNDTWEFGFTVGLGANIFLLPQLAIRAQASLQAPIYFTSGALYVGSGGAGLLVTGGVPFVQGNFTLGIVFAPGA
jgi:hypothetical protein